jgi:CubicO group peptidase (beta-lactamase class C family)
MGCLLQRGLQRGVWFAMFCANFLALALASDQPSRPQSAERFWQSVYAPPEQRAERVKREFSPALRERIGDAELLETLAMLAETLSSELVGAVPIATVDTADGREWQFALADGRQIALILALTATDPPLIDRFRVRPLPPAVTRVPPSQLAQVIRDRVNREHAAGRFSGVVLVARGEQVIHAQAIGLADRRSGRVNTLDMPFNLGSINKMFTAIAIAQLQAAGKLDWQDTVGEHLPDFPNATIRDQVTIHQLLTHTSGIGSYWNEAHAARLGELDSQQEFLATFVEEPLLFAPGKGLEYSNGGPVILGLIIEAISGLNYYAYVRKHLYQPAGMMHSDHYRRDDSRPDVAIGYRKSDHGAWRDNTETLSARGSAAGGGYASARDLHAFARALSNGRLLSRAQLETLWLPRSQTGPIGYGYLFSVGNTTGHRFIGHDGGAPGISAEFLYYPDDGLTIIVLANQDNAATALREWLHPQVEASLFVAERAPFSPKP